MATFYPPSISQALSYSKAGVNPYNGPLKGGLVIGNGAAPATASPSTAQGAGPTIYAPQSNAGFMQGTNSAVPSQQSAAMNLNQSIFQPRVLSTTSNLTGNSLNGGGAGTISTTVQPKNDPVVGLIAQAFAKAQAEANAANEKRYGQGLALQDASINAAKSLGADAANRINQQYQQDVGVSEQDAVRRGLGNTTIRNSLLDQNKRTRNDSLLSASEAVARNLQSAYQDKSGFVERRNDTGPDANAASQLLQAALSGSTLSGNSLASIAKALGLKLG